MSTINISIPDSLKKRIEHFALADGVELDTFITTILSQRIAVADADSYIQSRASKGSSEQMLDLLSKAPDLEPEENDRIITENKPQ